MVHPGIRMRPHRTIAGLLIVVLASAPVLTLMRSDPGWWTIASVMVTTAVLLHATFHAYCQSRRMGWFGFALFGWGYFALAIWPSPGIQPSELPTDDFVLAFSWIVRDLCHLAKRPLLLDEPSLMRMGHCGFVLISGGVGWLIGRQFDDDRPRYATRWVGERCRN